MNIGILGAGHIAETMAYTISQMGNINLVAIGSRDIKKALAFADKFGIDRAYGSYENLVADEDLDLIYIATPHSYHYEHCMLCIENYKNILCEKAFTANAQQAWDVIAAAKEKNVFICEAMWTRFLPMRQVLDGIIESGVIGDISSLTANLGYAIENLERLKRPELAGGALLDLGIYTINFALMTFGTDISHIKSSCTKNEFGVDLHNSIIINYADGKTAVLHSNMASNTDRRGIIYGNNGRIEVENINNCEGITVILNNGTITKYDTPAQITGYEYEVLAALKAISQGKLECNEMPHSETVRIMEIADGLRENWDIKYPFE